MACLPATLTYKPQYLACQQRWHTSPYSLLASNAGIQADMALLVSNAGIQANIACLPATLAYKILYIDCMTATLPYNQI
jgi:hypothetical protein